MLMETSIRYADAIEAIFGLLPTPLKPMRLCSTMTSTAYVMLEAQVCFFALRRAQSGGV